MLGDDRSHDLRLQWHANLSRLHPNWYSRDQTRYSVCRDGSQLVMATDERDT